ncbi:MAG: cystathionine beta-synthase [bacterium]|nr:cystathionine beta-synthase [bacterium]
MSLTSTACKNILSAIGETPIVKLNSVTKGLDANVYAKCEFMNPGGSVKDRIGVHIIDEAEKAGLLKPGGTIIEATSGNTGVGLAMTAATRGYKCIFVMADKQSEEKRTALRAMGAQVVICPTNVEPEDPRSYYQVADRLAKETPDSFYSSQYYNPANPDAHYRSTGPEIWRQCGAELDYFICSIGTGGTVTGTAKYLREQNKNIQIIGVDPVGSIFYELFHTGKTPKAHSYYVEGIGEDFMPGTMDLKCMNNIVQVTDRESFTMARRLIREEGLLVGGSSGSAVAGAIKFIKEKMLWQQKRLPNILVLLPDSSSRYLSKFLNDEWLKDAGLIDSEPIGGVVQEVLNSQKMKHKSLEVIMVDFDAALGDVIELMQKHGISQLPVLKANELVGLVNEVTILNALLVGKAVMNTPAGFLVDADILATVSPDTTIANLTELFAKGKSTIVIENKKIVGFITKIDLINHLSTISNNNK